VNDSPTNVNFNITYNLPVPMSSKNVISAKKKKPIEALQDSKK